MSNTIDYVSEIIKFNNDPEIIALREKYSEPTFFEVISKDRSETVYSSFLKWLFKDCTNGYGAVSPIMQLLNILVKRIHEEKKYELIDLQVQNAILSGALKIKDINVETELSISEYHERLKEDESLENNNQDRGNKDSKNRLDIFIDCNVEIPKADKYSRLQVIIENKIDSSHGDNQTDRYYENTKHTEKDNIIQLYVYLTPEKLKENKDINKYYIQIIYKDVLDNIINPLLSSISISSRSRFFLEEFKTQLSFPNPETGQTSIATSTESIALFTSIYNNFRTLIRDSAIAYTGLSFITTEEDKLKVTTKKEAVVKIEGHDELISFWEQNDKLLLSIMNGMSEREKVEELIQHVSKRPRIKYKIYNGDHPLSNEETGNAIAAKTIIQAWIDKQIASNNSVDLDRLRYTFPLDKVNPYYSKLHPNLFKYLFYEYQPHATGTKEVDDNSGYKYTYDHQNFPEDADRLITKKNTWDIDFGPEEGKNKNKHIIYLNGSANTKSAQPNHKVIMLKMWQKSGVEDLIKYALDILPELKVEEVANKRVIKTYQKEK